jgi:hypothetical protein
MNKSLNKPPNINNSAKLSAALKQQQTKTAANDAAVARQHERNLAKIDHMHPVNKGGSAR